MTPNPCTYLTACIAMRAGIPMACGRRRYDHGYDVPHMAWQPLVTGMALAVPLWAAIGLAIWWWLA